MVERVSTAIREALDAEGCELTYEATGIAARAAIQAMMTPTPAMLNAAVDATEAGSGMSWVNRSPQKLFEQGFSAMLTTALDT